VDAVDAQTIVTVSKVTAVCNHMLSFANASNTRLTNRRKCQEGSDERFTTQ